MPAMLLMPNCCRLVAGEAIDDVFDLLFRS